MSFSNKSNNCFSKFACRIRSNYYRHKLLLMVHVVSLKIKVLTRWVVWNFFPEGTSEECQSVKSTTKLGSKSLHREK